VLASGSSGNATYIQSGTTAVLVDSGLSCAELTRRLGLIGANPRDIDALLLSHEHGDHCSGVVPLSRRHGTTVYMNGGTERKAWRLSPLGGVVNFTTGEPFTVGCLKLTPFPVTHDAAEPVGFVVSDGTARAAIATDLGSVTLDVLQGFSGCDAVVLEANHDEEMLLEGPYPAWLKQRVLGPRGHLSNDDAAALIESVYHVGLRHLVLAHLSRTNNVPALPVESAKKALGRRSGGVSITLGWHDRVGELLKI